MPHLIDRVMGVGSLDAPELAALALAGGDLYEVALLRAYRPTQPRLACAAPIDDATTLMVRRISAALKDIPGGQLLGPTPRLQPPRFPRSGWWRGRCWCSRRPTPSR